MSLDFDPTKDHYKVLGVDPKATADDIKKAYRRLAKQNHPDSTGGDKAKEARFKEISNAYDVLGDAKKRSHYDAIRQGGFAGGRGGSPFPDGFPGGGFPGGAGGFRPGGADGAFDLGDLFGQFFSGGAGGRGGRVRVEHFDMGGDPAADAYARVRRRRGDTTEAEPESKVQASDGTWMSVQGSDVHSELRIPFDRAILGTVAEVATVDGKASVKIPPGTSSGKKLRLRGKGMNGPNGPGDQYVTVQIDVPKDLDDDAKKVLHDLVQRTTKGRKRP
jgi:DnaJ-class molecular chaperone